MKIGHLAKAIAHAKAIALAKWSVWVKNYECQKYVKNHSIRRLEFFCVKNCSKKHQIFEKWDDHENRPSCKGYSPCKMISLGQKLKCQPYAKKYSISTQERFCAKKTLEKSTKYSSSDTIFQNRPFFKGYSPCRGYCLRKMVCLGQKLEIPKTC